MRENCTSGSVRGASGNRRPYRSEEARFAIRKHLGIFPAPVEEQAGVSA